jgi:hypothetical protein
MDELAQKKIATPDGTRSVLMKPEKVSRASQTKKYGTKKTSLTTGIMGKKISRETDAIARRSLRVLWVDYQFDFRLHPADRRPSSSLIVSWPHYLLLATGEDGEFANLVCGLQFTQGCDRCSYLRPLRFSSERIW